ncbi:MAG TPA: Crp/Fnr family transcriptional regulator [Stenotrophomonas sp.]|nr:Crp/Fnr family transcriptional regulator [Stenotrophomonas sp.]
MTYVNPTATSRVLAALRAHPWFAEVDAPALQALQRHSRWLQLDAGCTVFREGEPALSCLLVCSGQLRGVRYTVDGQEKVFGHIGPGGWASVVSLFAREPRHLHSINTLEPVQGCVIDGAALRAQCLRHPALACHVLAHAAGLIDHHTAQIDWLTSSNAEERLAAYILRFGKPQPGEPVRLPLSNAQIAVKLGMRSETLSRLLGKWRQLGCIAKNRAQLRVLDVEFLRRLAAQGLPARSADGPATGTEVTFGYAACADAPRRYQRQPRR